MAVYWIGQDNNIWYKGDDGKTLNMGPAGSTVTRPDATGFYDPWAGTGETPMRFEATQIADPVVKQSAPSGGGGEVKPKPVLNQAAVNNTQGTIDQIPGLLAEALRGNETEYTNTTNKFNAQEKTQRDQYQQSSDTNMQNYDANMMDAVRAGVRGMANLMQLLRGTGVEGQARGIVGNQTAQDIRTGLDTRNENQTAVDNSLSTFLTDLGEKRKLAEDTKVNNERATRRDFSTQLQDLYGKMAGFYSDAEMTPQANEWMGKAGALTPEIAANSNRQVSAYDASPIQVKSPDISAFTAPKDQAVGYSEGNGQLGSGIFTLGEQRRRKAAAVAGY